MLQKMVNFDEGKRVFPESLVVTASFEIPVSKLMPKLSEVTSP